MAGRGASVSIRSWRPARAGWARRSPPRASRTCSSITRGSSWGRSMRRRSPTGRSGWAPDKLTDAGLHDGRAGALRGGRLRHRRGFPRTAGPYRRRARIPLPASLPDEPGRERPRMPRQSRVCARGCWASTSAAGSAPSPQAVAREAQMRLLSRACRDHRPLRETGSGRGSRRTEARDTRAVAVLLVRGAGDIGSTVALRLRQAGLAVVLHDEPAPAHPRRGMAFTDALFEGYCTLDGVPAKRASGLASLGKMLACGHALPVVDVDFDAVLATLSPDVLVDARMHKHDTPQAMRGQAALTIGLGPGFVAGENVDFAVETAWGDCLGQVIRCGAASAYTGEPRRLGGHGRARYVYAPAAGTLQTAHAIGVAVRRARRSRALPTPSSLHPFRESCAASPTTGRAWQPEPRSSKSIPLAIGPAPSGSESGPPGSPRAWQSPCCRRRRSHKRWKP